MDHESIVPGRNIFTALRLSGIGGRDILSRFAPAGKEETANSTPRCSVLSVWSSAQLLGRITKLFQMEVLSASMTTTAGMKYTNQSREGTPSGRGFCQREGTTRTTSFPALDLEDNAFAGEIDSFCSSIAGGEEGADRAIGCV